MPNLSKLERTFLFHWRVLADGAPEPSQEYRFAPPRRWRFDFAWRHVKVAVECQGGTWTRGRHSRGGGMSRDYEKHNAATAAGWRVFYCTTDMLETDPAAFVDVVRAAVLNLKAA